jgi:hypothetical protein
LLRLRNGLGVEKKFTGLGAFDDPNNIDTGVGDSPAGEPLRFNRLFIGYGLDWRQGYAVEHLLNQESRFHGHEPSGSGWDLTVIHRSHCPPQINDRSRLLFEHRITLEQAGGRLVFACRVLKNAMRFDNIVNEVSEGTSGAGSVGWLEWKGLLLRLCGGGGSGYN